MSLKKSFTITLVAVFLIISLLSPILIENRRTPINKATYEQLLEVEQIDSYYARLIIIYIEKNEHDISISDLKLLMELATKELEI